MKKWKISMKKINSILISQTIKALKSRGFRTSFANDKKEAKDIILRKVPENSTMDIGGFNYFVSN